MSDIKRKYLDYDGLQALWDKIKASDNSIIESISTVDNKVEEFNTAIEDVKTEVSNLKADMGGFESSIEALNQTTTIHTSDIEYLKSAVENLEPGGGTGEITYVEITRENDNYIGTSTKAPTTTSVVTALNEIEDKVDAVQEQVNSISLEDYYNKEEIDGMFESITVEEINNLK